MAVGGPTIDYNRRGEVIRSGKQDPTGNLLDGFRFTYQHDHIRLKKSERQHMKMGSVVAALCILLLSCEEASEVIIVRFKSPSDPSPVREIEERRDALEVQLRRVNVSKPRNAYAIEEALEALGYQFPAHSWAYLDNFDGTIVIAHTRQFLKRFAQDFDLETGAD